MDSSKELYNKLAKIGVRIFVLTLGYRPEDKQYFIHANKTTDEWREDVRKFKDSNSVYLEDEGYWATDKVFNTFYRYLEDLGYCEIDDVCADVFNGKIVPISARLVDNPVFDSQVDGFGHYGWESKL